MLGAEELIKSYQTGWWQDEVGTVGRSSFKIWIISAASVMADHVAGIFTGSITRNC